MQYISLLLPSWVNSASLNFVIDSGSSITVISRRIFEHIDEPCKPVLFKAHERLLLADGKDIPILGRADVSLEFGPLEFTHNVLVADIKADGLLGNDFLKPHGCNIDYKHNCVRIDNVSVYYKEVGDETSACRVEVSQTVTIPAGEQVILNATLKKRGKCSSDGMIHSTEQFLKKTGLMIGKSLVTSHNKSVPLRVLNLTDEPKTLFKGTNAGIYHPVSEVIDDPDIMAHMIANTTIGDATHISKHQTLPEHVNRVFENSQEHLTDSQKDLVKSLLYEYKDIFAKDDHDLGRTSQAVHTIDTGDARPIRQAPRRLPIHQKQEAEAPIANMLKRGVIEESNSPWASPIVLVKKKDGSTRFCVDYRKINEVTRKDAYPLPRIEESLDALSGAVWFSTLDLCSGYWQVEVEPKGRPKTAFTTSCGLFQFTVMPFGLCNAPSTFERLMEMALKGLHWDTCLVYLDDLIIHATCFDDELSRLRNVFDRLRAAGLKLKGKKCDLFKKEVLYLGHVVSETGVHTDPSKIESVEKWPTPKCVKDVRSYLGLTSYYRKFIKGYAEIARPLHKLTELGVTFKWTEKCEEAFVMLKLALTSAPILAYPNVSLPFILDTDACDSGVGGVLSQVQDGNERVIAFASRAMSKSERRYCVTRKELLAIVHFVKYFKHYLYGRRFLVRTDHGALRWLFNFRSPEGQVARWLEILSSFDFAIEHRAGRNHGNADGMSRRPCNQCGYGTESEFDDLLSSEDYKQRAKDILSVNKTPCLVANRLTRHSQNQNDKLGTDCWLDGWTPAQLRAAQMEDPVIHKFVSWITSNSVKPCWSEVSSEGLEFKTLWHQWSRMEVHDGVLYRRWVKEETNNTTLQLVLPKSMKKEVLTALHDAPTSGHLGINRTLQMIKQRFFWYHMKLDIQTYISKCDKCTKHKVSPKQKKALHGRQAVQETNISW